MRIKTAAEIAEEINKRGPVTVPEGCFADDSFEHWLRRNEENEDADGGDKK